MNDALQSYTPLARPLGYDSIQAKDGFEFISGGNAFYGFVPFYVNIVGFHPVDDNFNQADTTSYSMGPASAGVDGLGTPWTVWVSGVGIRVAPSRIVAFPDNTSGVPTALFPSYYRPVKITHAWTAHGLLMMAYQDSDTQTVLRRYINTSGGTSTLFFQGRSAVMINQARITGVFDGRVVIFYLKDQFPHTLYARFEQDSFTVERIVHPYLRIPPKRLVGVDVLYGGITQVLRYEDYHGRDVILVTPTY